MEKSAFIEQCKSLGLRYDIEPDGESEIRWDKPKSIAAGISFRGYLETLKWFYDRFRAELAKSLDDLFINACAVGNKEIAQYLLDMGATINRPDRSCLEFAPLDMKKWLFERGADIHAVNNSALHFAGYNGQVENVKWFLTVGDFTDEPGLYPMICERMMKHDHATIVEMIESMVAHGFDPHYDHDAGFVRSCEIYSIETLAWYMDRFAPIDQLGFEISAMHAISNNKIEVADWLVSRGSNPKTSKLLSITYNDQKESLITASDAVERLEWMKRHGVNACDPGGVLFLYACGLGKPDVVEWFVANGQDIRVENDKALRRATEFGQTDIAERLIELGCDPLAGDVDDNLLLSCASTDYRAKLMLKWAEQKRFQFPDEWYRSTLVECCIESNYKKLKYLYESWKVITDEHGYDTLKKAFEKAFSQNAHQTVKYLMKICRAESEHIPEIDLAKILREDDDKLFKIAAQNNYVVLLDILMAEFPGVYGVDYIHDEKNPQRIYFPAEDSDMLHVEMDDRWAIGFTVLDQP
mgnify:CR=1 FL=1